MPNMYGYNTSTAYRLEINEIDYRHNKQHELHTESKKKVKSKNTTKSKNKLGNLISVMLVFVAAFLIVNGYVSINEANSKVAQLKGEYNDVVATNQALQVKIDKTIDLRQLQTVAGEKFGMVSPERYQMFYVNLEMNDFAEKTAKGKDGEKAKKVAVMGAPGIFTGALNIFQ